MNRAATLQQLTQLCNLNREGVAPPAIEASGHPELDARLPHGGWQSGTIVELMPAEIGIGEFRLLMPAVSRITQGERYVALVSPPYIPFAPALKNHGVRLDHLLVIRAEKNTDTLWTLEQTLRCKSFGAVVGWPTSIRDRDVRRLQLAAEAGRSTGFIYRPPVAALEASPAAVRMRLQTNEQGLLIDVLKCRGTRGGFSIALNHQSLPSEPHAQQPENVSGALSGLLAHSLAANS
ncbi:hypothetical protein HNQ60_004541 [Povalibacter uvarum]|uniref:Translesion DNA synthesis-associated protein ImuA n=1 Tax=Povalibacter uvarum TaxID=732238 RepID=A0A841HTW7_9GAMM|nr:translesion DNA synthesis-associated protein ImuA [Povalibacter uvarum]MBB6095650.1 hypothetical protein [Povalibacter uvarum]